MKCPKGTVEISLWLNDHGTSAIYFDGTHRARDSSQATLVLFEESGGHAKAMIKAVCEHLKPVLDLLEPDSELSQISDVHLFTPEEFETLTEGLHYEMPSGDS